MPATYTQPTGFQGEPQGPSSLPGYTAPRVNYSTPRSAFDVSTPAGVSAVTQYINQLNRQSQQAALRARIPGAQGLEEQSTNMIRQELAGQIPSDVLYRLGQAASERGARTGQGAGGQNEMAAYLQALGLTSIGQQRQGQTDLTAAYGRNPAAPLFDPTTQLITPYQQGSLHLQAQEAEDRTRLQQEQLAVERARIAAGADAAASRYASASGGGGAGGRPSGTSFHPSMEGFGGEFVAYSPNANTQLGLTIPTEPYGINSWWQPNYANQTGTGTGSYYAGSASGYQQRGDLENDFWDPLLSGTTTGDGYGGLPGNDFVSNGFVGSNAGPVDIQPNIEGEFFGG